jgi:ABC-type dipeptide/oligopeptide/nickel transport system permease component
LPATLELITYAAVIAFGLGLTLGTLSARRRKSWTNRGVFGYALLAGAITDFWLALLLVYIFSFHLHLTPPPIGRLGFADAPPQRTGFYTVDSLIAGDFQTFWLSVEHLILPVSVLVIVYMGQIIKIARISTEAADKSAFVSLYDGFGVAPRVSRRRAVRLALPSTLTITAVMYGYLLGGAVLVETVFSWGGIGEYAVQAVRAADYPAMQGFMLIAATFSILVYLVADLVLLVVDPRIGRIG